MYTNSLTLGKSLPGTESIVLANFSLFCWAENLGIFYAYFVVVRVSWRRSHGFQLMVGIVFDR